MLVCLLDGMEQDHADPALQMSMMQLLRRARMVLEVEAMGTSPVR